MHSPGEGSRSQAFWRVCKIWCGIMALPGAFFLWLMSSSALSSPNWFVSFFLPAALVWVVAPGVVFGTIGAALMTLWVRPGQPLRAFFVGAGVGFSTPAIFFTALAILLPKNEATLGWALFGVVFAMTGGFAGIMAANVLKNE